MINKLIKFFLENRLLTFLLLLVIVAWGLVTSPFRWNIGLPNDPVPVDAIPDIGENQQIVFTEWNGRSPKDIEDQVTYPLTSTLLGIPGVRTIRSSSILGVSSIYIIFEDDVEFYWSRSRILEKLNSLPNGLLPEGVQPTLGPDATALGQIFWYTIEGRDEEGNPAGGWDPQDIRSVQDYTIRYALASANGVSEVSSIGGFVKEYQVDLDPKKMEQFGVSIPDVVKAVKESNLDIGAKTIEINQAEYLVRGLGYIKSLKDLELASVKTVANTPILLRDIANINLGPASRRGALDKSGAEAVGGAIVARYGTNPLEVIEAVKSKIDEISTGLPSKVLDDGRISQLTIIPFYDRTQLIKETIGTLEEALTLEVLITIIVILVMMLNLRASILVSSLLPIAVLMCFIAMRYLGVDANIVALAGIAIAIGTMVDVGIVMVENIVRHINKDNEENLLTTIYNGAKEVSPAILTAVMTTIISFIPVMTLEAAEGKLFQPLAYTKTFALMAAIVVAILIIPTLTFWFFGLKSKSKILKITLNSIVLLFGCWIIFEGHYIASFFLIGIGLVSLIRETISSWKPYIRNVEVVITVVAASLFLSKEWVPLGANSSTFLNFIFVIMIIGIVLGSFRFFIDVYPKVLNWCLSHRKVFLILPFSLILFGLTTWLGFDKVFNFIPKTFGESVKTNQIYSKLSHQFPGIGSEFMPSLGEGAFLLMPTSMPHAGIQQNREVLRMLDMAVTAIPEVESVVGKLGRTESALDPAPISMYENLINYKSEYITDENGRKLRFEIENGEYKRDQNGDLIQDPKGSYFRQWREEITSPDDIWNEIVKATKLPGVTSAPKLQPIETRLVMLQTGMRAPMGVKIKGPNLETIEKFGLELEQILKEVPSVKTESVFAERVVGKPYLLVDLNREAMALYGLSIVKIQEYLQAAIGGMPITSTVEGRERYSIRVRYPRELRNSPESLENILIPVSKEVNLPLSEFASIRYEQGPQVIKSEDSFLISYLIFDKQNGVSETVVVEQVDDYIKSKLASGDLSIPEGVSFEFAGNYQNQLRAEQRLSLIIPVVCLVIFVILYLQFKSVSVSLMVFSGIAVAFGGGFIMLWLYGQDYFMDFHLFGTHMRSFLQIQDVNLSVAVWVGFIALFGIATDDGVLMATYLDQSFKDKSISNEEQIKALIITAGKRRIRPCLMTTATTLLALVPILSSTGRGADVMIPMAIPVFGGMLVAIITLFVVPVLYSIHKEFQMTKKLKGGQS